MERTDLPFADGLRAGAGWNQTVSDWRRLLAHDPKGCFVAEREGQPAGTVTTTVYGSELAWVGMLLVHPAHRGEGIGRSLLQHALEHLRGTGVRCIKLDATPAGLALYEGNGFQPEWRLQRWERMMDHATGSSASTATKLPPPMSRDLDAIIEADAESIGVSRARWLTSVLSDAISVNVCERSGQVRGFGVVRDGARAAYLGPLVVDEPEQAHRLVMALLSDLGRSVFWDIPNGNVAAERLAAELGFVIQRPLTRMYWGRNVCGKVERLFGIGGPEVG